jgi:hypothetical protein
VDDSGKLDATLREALNRAPARSAEQPVTVLVRGRDPFTPEQVADLASCGARVRTVLGDVLTADVPVEALPALCDRAFVVAVAAAGPLFPESAAG